MKTEFDIGQEVWILYSFGPRLVKVQEINIIESNDIYYVLLKNGSLIHQTYKEEYIGVTKEDLKNKLFK